MKDHAPNCPECNKLGTLTTGKRLYPDRPDLEDTPYYYCVSCDTRVGVHARTGKPYGTMASSDLRWKRQNAHKAFDALWKTGLMSRDSAYLWLAKKMDMDAKECHIGQFGVRRCEKVIKFCEDLV